mmetsp:Transcript_11978/g.19491  ORF Transcript_11978/g.19491 Transcript_11978/m.19491 type:complete len:468 (-) Transcript_11978:264-1667(-)
MSGLHIARGGINRGLLPTSTCAFCAREGLWQHCAGCLVTYYCSKSCQLNHKSEHEDFCLEVKTKKEFIQQRIYSIRQLVQEGNVVHISYTGDIKMTVGRYEFPAHLLNLHDCMIAPVLKVEVHATNPKKSVQVNAAFSVSACVSVISERLATKIGLTFDPKDVIDVVSPRSWKQVAFLPKDCLTVQCVSSVVSTRTPSGWSSSSGEYFCPNNQTPVLQVAPIVCPTMTVDLLLGRDWFQHFGPKTSVVYGPGNDTSQIKCASGTRITLPWEKLDCSPRYNRNTSYMDHIMRIDETALCHLDTLKGFTSIESWDVCSFNGGMIDSVMSLHDVPPDSGPSASEMAEREALQKRYGGDSGGERSGTEKDDLSEISGQSEEWLAEGNVKQESYTCNHDKVNDNYEHREEEYYQYNEEEVGNYYEHHAENYPNEDYQAALPHPWEQYWTPAGDVYYYNTETGESTYTHPSVI